MLKKFLALKLVKAAANKWFNYRFNRLRKKAMNDKRFWRATSNAGTTDLGHIDEAEAVARTAKMGPIAYVDWEQAIIIYNAVPPQEVEAE